MITAFSGAGQGWPQRLILVGKAGQTACKYLGDGRMQKANDCTPCTARNRYGLEQPKCLPLHAEKVGREAGMQPEALATRRERGRAAVGEGTGAALAAMPKGRHWRKIGGVGGEAQRGIERGVQRLGLGKGQGLKVKGLAARWRPHKGHGNSATASSLALRLKKP